MPVSISQRTLIAVALSCCLALGLTPLALAQTASSNPASIASCQYVTDSFHTNPFCSSGETANVTVPAGGTVTYSFAYPGDNSNITFTAQIPEADLTAPTAVGFNVFDATSQAKPPNPVETATIQSNGVSSDPRTMQFNYSSGTPGTVTLDLFNFTAKPATIAMSHSGLVTTNGATVPVTLTLGATPGAAPASPSPAASRAPSASPAPPASAAPSASTAAAGPNGNPTIIASCQYTTDNVHAFPFCSTGAMNDVHVPAGSKVAYTFDYPGDNSNITVTAQIAPIDPTAITAVGFNVFDATSQAKPPNPVETATIQSNDLGNAPDALQFNYSSGTAGAVILELFNFTSKPVTFSMNHSGLLPSSNGPAVPVSLKLAA